MNIDTIKLSPNFTEGRNGFEICRITPHCTSGIISAENLGIWFGKKSTKSSANYGIGKNGEIGQYVLEENRSWCSSNRTNDFQAITIECCSENTYPYKISDIVASKFILLCVDICKRYKKRKIVYFEDKETALNYKTKPDEMLITLHKWFANTECPGEYMIQNMYKWVSEINKMLANESANETLTIYRVQVGAFTSRENAELMVKSLKTKGFNGFIV